MLGSRFWFAIRALRERLWVKPLGNAIGATAIVLIASFADSLPFKSVVPEISAETVEKLLTVISASMLGVATFAVASMVSAYASAGGSATPRAFTLVISDNVSQNALSSFIGAFIYSIVGIVAIEVSFFGTVGRFVIFILTLVIFGWVVLTFVRWVDNIARLGRLGNTIEKVEVATTEALAAWLPAQPLGGTPALAGEPDGIPIFSKEIGYVQHIDMGALENWAQKHQARISVRSVPGSFVSQNRPLLSFRMLSGQSTGDIDAGELLFAFVISDKRTFAADPRFGLIVLAEIASRALSPAVNDPGTAIDIVNRITRILLGWQAAAHAQEQDEDKAEPPYPSVSVPPLAPEDLLEDAFAPIARDGVTAVEVGVWLQKAFCLLTQADDERMRQAALRHSTLALERAEEELTFSDDVERLRRAARMVKPTSSFGRIERLSTC